jgi:hypothetical protein
MPHTLWCMGDRSKLPLLVAVTSNLMDLGPFESAAARAGYRFERVGPEALDDVGPLVAFVDLETAGADQAIIELARRRVKVIAYGPHVDDVGMLRALALGATSAEPRSRALKDPTVYLPPLV